jgi:hypothetical protein
MRDDSIEKKYFTPLHNPMRSIYYLQIRPSQGMLRSVVFFECFMAKPLSLTTMPDGLYHATDTLLK